MLTGHQVLPQLQIKGFCIYHGFASCLIGIRQGKKTNPWIELGNGKQVVRGLMMIEIQTDKPETVKSIRFTSEHLRLQGDLGC